MSVSRPQVGVGLIIIKDNKILLGKRKGSHGAGEFGGLGGHLEHGESFEETALREMLEEAGPDLRITKPRFLCVTNLIRYLPKHYVDIGMIAEWRSGEPKVMEPHKLESWGWYDIDNLPQPIFEPISNYLNALKTGQSYFKS